MCVYILTALLGRRRRSLRNLAPIKSEIPHSIARSRNILRTYSNSPYPTPDQSEISRNSGKHGATSSVNGESVTPAAISKVLPPTPSVSPPPPIIYDTIEVMLGPPLEYCEAQKVHSKVMPSAKRKHTRTTTSRRSKRIKLDDQDIFEKSDIQSENPGSEPDADVEKTTSYKALDIGNRDRSEAAEPLEVEDAEGEDKAGLNQGPQEGDRQSSPIEVAVGEMDEINQTEVVNRHSNTEESMDAFEDALEPSIQSPEVEAKVATVLAKSLEPAVNIDDWLITDIDQSVENESVRENRVSVPPTVEFDHLPAKETTKIYNTRVDQVGTVNEKDVAMVQIGLRAPEALVSTISNTSNNPISSPEEDSVNVEGDMSIGKSEEEKPLSETEEFTRPASDEPERVASPTRDSIKDISDLEPEAQREETPRTETQVDPIAAVMDEARINLSDSAMESPSPPLRTALPKLPASWNKRSKPTVKALNVIIRGQDPPVIAEIREFLKAADEFSHSTPRSRPRFKNASISSPPLRFRRLLPAAPPRRSAERAKEPLRTPPRSRHFELSSTEGSRFSTPTSGRSASTPPVQTIDNLDRRESPSFGLWTIPRPVARPPSRPSRGRIRHINQDLDIRSKIMMARPKTAIPSHITASEYARECLEAATASRLPPYLLDPAEHRLLRAHINHVQVTTYLNIRNGILRLWLLNPTIGICREEALGVAKEERHLEMAAKCHEFLVRNGYINFGCIEPPRPLRRPVEATKTRLFGLTKQRKRIVVIGAGAAGLGCARQLRSLLVQFSDRFPLGEELPEVIVLEGRDRIGGRIYSKPVGEDSAAGRPGSSSMSNLGLTMVSSDISRPASSSASFRRVPEAAVDLGAQIVTGFDNGNPLAPIVKRQLNLRWNSLSDDSTLFNDEDGARVDEIEDIRAEKLFNEILDRASLFRDKPKDQPLIEGNRELMDLGKEPSSDSGRPIAKIEENEAVLPPMPPSPPLSVFRDSTLLQTSNRPSPKPNIMQKLRTPARRTLAKMGFKLKDMESGMSAPEGQCLSDRATLGETMKNILLNIQDFTELSPMDLKLLNWHWANLEYGNATNLDKLSVMHWDQDDGNE